MFFSSFRMHWHKSNRLNRIPALVVMLILGMFLGNWSMVPVLLSFASIVMHRYRWLHVVWSQTVSEFGSMQILHLSDRINDENENERREKERKKNKVKSEKKEKLKLRMCR